MVASNPWPSLAFRCCCYCCCLVAKWCPTLLRPHGLSMGFSPLSMEFSRWEYWSGLPCPSPGDLPDQGSNPCLLYLLHWQADSLLLSHLGNLASRDISPVFLSAVTWPSLCVPQCLNIPHLSLIKTSVTGFRAHSNPLWPCLNLIMSAKDPIFRYWQLRLGQIFWEAHNNTPCSSYLLYLVMGVHV